MLVLQGSEYVEVKPTPRLSPTGKYDYDDIPSELRANEAIVRNTSGARNPTWLRRHLTSQGCAAAVLFKDRLWLRCPNKPREHGYCGQHAGRAAE